MTLEREEGCYFFVFDFFLFLAILALFRREGRERDGVRWGEEEEEEEEEESEVTRRENSQDGRSARVGRSLEHS